MIYKAFCYKDTKPSPLRYVLFTSARLLINRDHIQICTLLILVTKAVMFPHQQVM